MGNALPQYASNAFVSLTAGGLRHFVDRMKIDRETTSLTARFEGKIQMRPRPNWCGVRLDPRASVGAAGLDRRPPSTGESHLSGEQPTRFESDTKSIRCQREPWHIQKALMVRCRIVSPRCIRHIENGAKRNQSQPKTNLHEIA